MTAIPYAHIDAFADRPFTGNQAAVMLLDAWLDDGLLQAIAAENMFAETAYLVPDASGKADYELRWFTPALEVALCGHATLASGFYMLNRNDSDRIRFATRKAGILEVWRENGDGGEAYAMALPGYPPTPVAMPDWAASLGGMPLECHSHDGGYHLLLYSDAPTVAALRPDFKALAAAAGDAAFICTAPGAGHASGADIISRVFVPGAGIDEDSVTGSAHCVLTPFWAQRLGRATFTAYQASGRGGHIGCTDAGERTILQGNCVTVVEGIFRV